MRLTLFAAAVSAAVSQGPAIAEPFSFVLLGDVPYGVPEQVYPRFRTLIDTINAGRPDLVIHVGDTKAARTPCTDALLADQLGFLNSFDAPTLYTPGDNEWTDCHLIEAGGHDPLERLDRIRRTYFDRPDRSFGRGAVAVDHQGDEGYPENVRFMRDGIVFVTAHVVGSNNGFEPHDNADVDAARARDAANIRWLEAGYAAAGEAHAMVVAIHADMFAAGFGPPGQRREAFAAHSGHAAFGTKLKQVANAFGKPVLLVFGDGHRFRMFRPFPGTAPTVMALETFGAGDMHAVEVQVTPESGFPFAVRPLLNPAVPMRLPD